MGTRYNLASEKFIESALDDFDRYSVQRGFVWTVIGLVLIVFWLAIGFVAFQFASSFY